MAPDHPRHRHHFAHGPVAHHHREQLAGPGIHRQVGGKALGSGCRLWPRHPQYRLAMAHHLGHLAKRLGRLQKIHSVAGRIQTRCRREDDRSGRCRYPESSRVDCQAQGRWRHAKDLVHVREGQLLVQQLHEHHLVCLARTDLRCRQSPGSHDFAWRWSPAWRLVGRRRIGLAVA